jgi:hypothetical protein
MLQLNTLKGNAELAQKQRQFQTQGVVQPQGEPQGGVDPRPKVVGFFQSRRGGVPTNLLPFFGLLFFLFLGIGLWLYIASALDLKELKTVVPSKDFKFLGEACQIQNVIHLAEEETFCESGGDSCDWVSYCMDRYTYSFTMDDSRGTADEIIFSGLTENQKRAGKDRDCDSSKSVKLPSKFNVGEDVDCWEGVASQSHLDEWYSCYNDDCIKITDPELEKGDLVADLEETQMQGTDMLLGAGGIFMFWFCLLRKWMSGNWE